MYYMKYSFSICKFIYQIIIKNLKKLNRKDKIRYAIRLMIITILQYSKGVESYKKHSTQQHYYTLLYICNISIHNNMKELHINKIQRM